MHYDAILLVSFGGPERVADVIPFLENVLRGRNVPRERMLHVAENHYHFGGRSPTLSVGGFVAAMAIFLGGALLLGLMFALLGPFLVR